MINLEHFIAITILEQTGEFNAQKILDYVQENFPSIINDSILDVISKKIEALWGANVLTSVGFSYYYVNK